MPRSLSFAAEGVRVDALGADALAVRVPGWEGAYDAPATLRGDVEALGLRFRGATASAERALLTFAAPPAPGRGALTYHYALHPRQK